MSECKEQKSSPTIYNVEFVTEVAAVISREKDPNKLVHLFQGHRFILAPGAGTEYAWVNPMQIAECCVSQDMIPTPDVYDYTSEYGYESQEERMKQKYGAGNWKFFSIRRSDNDTLFSFLPFIKRSVVRERFPEINLDN